MMQNGTKTKENVTKWIKINENDAKRTQTSGHPLAEVVVGRFGVGTSTCGQKKARPALSLDDADQFPAEELANYIPHGTQTVHQGVAGGPGCGGGQNVGGCLLVGVEGSGRRTTSPTAIFARTTRKQYKT